MLLILIFDVINANDIVFDDININSYYFHQQDIFNKCAAHFKYYVLRNDIVNTNSES